MADFLRELEAELYGRSERWERALAASIPLEAIAEIVMYLDRGENVPDHIARNVKIIAEWLKV